MTERARGRGGDPLAGTLPEPPPASGTRSEDTSRADGQASGLAGILQELPGRYREVPDHEVRDLRSGGQAQIWVVKDSVSKDNVVLKVYDRGFAPDANVLESLAALPKKRTAHLVNLIDHGQLADDRWYEVQEYLPNGTLRDLIKDGRTETPYAMRAVVEQLAAAIGYIHKNGIDHQDLKPGNVFVRSPDPLNLVLGDFGMSSVVDRSKRLSRLKGMTWSYAPPEAYALSRDDLMLWRHKFDWWAVGMMAVEMLTGRNPLPRSEKQIATFFAVRNLDDLTEGVEDDDWRTLCRGLLRRDPEKRWELEQVRKWLRNPRDPALQVADEASPSQSVFRFSGKNYASLSDLAAAFAADWSQAQRVWTSRQNDLVTWVVDQKGARGVGARLQRIDHADDLILDAQLFLAIRALDEQQQSFKGVELTGEKLARLGKHACAHPNDQAGRVLRDLCSSRVLAISDQYGPPLNLAGAAEVAGAWSDTLAAYETLCEEHETRGLEQNDDDRATLIAAATPGSGVMDILRNRANTVLTTYSLASECGWFSTLGTVENADGPALLAMTYLAQHAHEDLREERRRAEVARAAVRAEAAAARKRGRVTDVLCVLRGTAAGILLGLSILVFFWVDLINPSLLFSNDVYLLLPVSVAVFGCTIASLLRWVNGCALVVGLLTIHVIVLWFSEDLCAWLGDFWAAVLLLGLATLVVLCEGLGATARGRMPLPWTWSAVGAGALATFGARVAGIKGVPLPRSLDFLSWTVDRCG